MLQVLLTTFLLSALPGESLYLDARSAEDAHDSARAAELYLECATVDGPLAAYANVGAARNLARQGQAARAAVMLEKLADEEGAPWRRLARFELALIQLDRGDSAGAVAGFDAALDFETELWWLHAYRWRAAEAYLKIDDTRPKGMAYFRGVAETNPYRGPRLDAAVFLADSSRSRDRMSAAWVLVRARKFGDAARVAATVAPAMLRDPSLAAQWRHVSGAILLGQKKEDAGQTVLTRLAEDRPDSPWARTAIAYLVRALIRNDRHAEAASLADGLQRAYPDSDEAFSARLALASDYARNDRTHQAIEQYEILLENFADEARIGEALTGLGDLYREAGQIPEALEVYGSLSVNYAGSEWGVDANYWSATLLEASGQPERAAVDYHAAASRGIGLYYGHRAKARLADSESEPELPHRVPSSLVVPIPQPAAKLPELTEPDTRIERLRFFAGQGLPEAEWEMAALIPELHGPDSAALFHAIGETGNAFSAMQVADATAWGVRDDGSQTTARLRVRFPRAYWDEVAELSRELDVDPYLILSVARQESTYRPSLTSHAGAVGIMQVMPSTARWLADADERVDASHVRALNRPANSLRVGAVYLNRLLEKYDGNVVYAVAAYNAGPGNCDKWVRRTPKASPAGFIEAIPFPETKNYVKKVLANYMTYYSIYPPLKPD